MKPDSEVARRLEATRKVYAMVAVQAEHEPDKQSNFDRLDFKRQLHILEVEIDILASWLGTPGEQPERDKRGCMGPTGEKHTHTILKEYSRRYSSILNEAEKDEENQSIEESEHYRYRLHGCGAKVETYQWLLDLNAHSQPTGEHLVREAQAILATPPKAG